MSVRPQWTSTDPFIPTGAPLVAQIFRAGLAFS